jgi:tRNA (guanine-N(7)-)-methyltransferase subunit TRM82
VVFGDKFGDVSVATAAPTAAAEAPAGQPREPAPLLGHMQAIVTSALVLPGDGLLVTTDRDAKVRVSVLPADPLGGSYQIQAYCMGHREFAGCAVAVPAPGGGDGPARGAKLLTGGGDGAVKLWDPVSGKLLGSYGAVSEEQLAAATAVGGEEAGTGGGGGGAEAEGDGEEEAQPQGGDDGQEEGGSGGGDDTAGGGDGDGDGDGDGGVGRQQQPYKPRKALVPVVGVALAPAGDLAAVVVEGQREVQLIKVDAAAGALGPCVQRLAVPDDVLAPCRAAFDGTGRLWLVGGPPVQATTSAHVAVAAPSAGSGGARAPWLGSDALSCCRGARTAHAGLLPC